MKIYRLPRKKIPAPDYIDQNYVFAFGGKVWVPTEPAELINFTGMKFNPAMWSDKWKQNMARLFVGLTAGRDFPPALKKGKEIADDLVFGYVSHIRRKQVGGYYGASFVSQIGHWIDEKYRELEYSPEEALVEEKSLQIIIFPAPTESENLEVFERNIRELAEFLLEVLAQNSIIVEWTTNGKVTIQSADWVEEA
jgi:hypothetical protein